MVITDTTQTTVAGVTLDGHLLNELNAFALSVPGNALLTPLLNNPAVSVTIKAAGPTATNAQSVTVNTAQTGVPQAVQQQDLNLLKEMVESVIFELTNVSNHAGFLALGNQLKQGAIALRPYGQAKADLEAQASWNLAQILAARGAYVPSAFGHAHIQACQGHTTLPTFQGFFRTQPHDIQAVPTDVMSLPSEELYAYKGAVILASGNGLLTTALGAITDTRNGKTISPDKLKGALGNQANSLNTTQPARAARYYWVVVKALKQASPTVASTWPHGQYADWKFTARMKAVAPDDVDPWQPKVAAWINNKKQDMYI